MKSQMDSAAHYEQPVPNFTARSMKGSQEYVNFIPQSHLRIYFTMEAMDTIQYYT